MCGRVLSKDTTSVGGTENQEYTHSLKYALHCTFYMCTYATKSATIVLIRV